MKTREVTITQWYCEKCERWLSRELTITCEACEKIMCHNCGDYQIGEDVDLCTKCSKELESAEKSLADVLLSLAKEGCYPGVYRRGNLWRAHIHVSGNWWADRECPLQALIEAEKVWKVAGKPMDGAAAK